MQKAAVVTIVLALIALIIIAVRLGRRKQGGKEGRT